MNLQFTPSLSRPPLFPPCPFSSIKWVAAARNKGISHKILFCCWNFATLKLNWKRNGGFANNVLRTMKQKRCILRNEKTSYMKDDRALIGEIGEKRRGKWRRAFVYSQFPPVSRHVKRRAEWRGTQKWLPTVGEEKGVKIPQIPRLLSNSPS